VDLNSNQEQLLVYGHLPDTAALVQSLPTVPITYLLGSLQDLTEPGWAPGAYLTRMRGFMSSLPNGRIVDVEAGHGIPVEDPQAVAREINALREQR
jgi:pimeloyl-ACP methyl ester carboxylesterase